MIDKQLQSKQRRRRRRAPSQTTHVCVGAHIRGGERSHGSLGCSCVRLRVVLCYVFNSLIIFYTRTLRWFLQQHRACITEVTVTAQPRSLCFTVPPIKVICESALNWRRHNVIAAVWGEKGMNSLLRPISGDRWCSQPRIRWRVFQLVDWALCICFPMWCYCHPGIPF